MVIRWYIKLKFKGEHKMKKDIFYYGMNIHTGKPIYYDRRQSAYSNSLITGTSGTGKSTFAIKEIEQILQNTEDDVIILDMNGDYEELVKKNNGTIIDFLSPNTHMDPLYTPNYINNNLEHEVYTFDDIIGLCCIAMDQELGSIEIKSIYNILKKLYKNFENPSFQNFYEMLIAETDHNMRNVGLHLKYYVDMMPYLFEIQTNKVLDDIIYNPKKRIIAYKLYNTQSCNASFYIMLCLIDIWQKITYKKNQQKRTWIYFDNIYLILQNTVLSDTFAKIYKRGRKWGCISTCVIDDIEKLCSFQLGRIILCNTSFLISFNQRAAGRDIIQQLFNINDQVMSCMQKGLGVGEGLQYIHDKNDEIIVFRQ